MYLSQSVFSQRQEKEPLTHGIYSPGSGAQSNLYGPSISAVSGLSSTLSIHPPGTRGLTSASAQYAVSRANTAPVGYGGMGGIGAISQFGAPSPPPARGGMLPLGSGRSALMSTGQGLTVMKPPTARPSSLSSAVGSALPINSYGGLGRSAQGMMSPISSAYSSASFSVMDGTQGLDPSDFPELSLNARARQDSLTSGSTALPIRPGFGNSSYSPGIAKPVESVPGFQMHSEDFPALPGTSSKANESDVSQESKFTMISSSMLPEPRSSLGYDPAPGSNKDRWSGISTPIGPPKGATRKSHQPTTVSIPPGMVQDQFGMMGLLTFIRGAETDPNLVSLALGSDLTTLGLNLNSPESLYNTFASPWADSPCRAQDIDYNVPQEYLIHPYIRDKLAQIRLNRYNEDLLFYLYYSNGGDLLQVLAATELYGRDWRYHKEERLWITRAPGMKPTKQEGSFEEGTYCYFDAGTWRKAHKEFHVEYDKLEDRPQMPPNILSQQSLPIPTQA